MLRETSYILPKINDLSFLPKKKDRTKPLLLLGYSHKLDQTKNKISSINYDDWINMRKIMNNFEFPYQNRKIKRPISRAFFKLTELLIDHDIDLNCNTLHLAESPGGFIEACIDYKIKKYKQVNQCYTFSLHHQDKEEVPKYDDRIVKNKNVTILSNNENKGDLYSIKNIQYLITTLKDKKIKFITCDGGFSEKNDFSAKENLHHKLIFHQMIISLFILEHGGSVVVKFFDIFTELSFDFLYLLGYLFDRTYICKPHTSRPTNSERYIMCKFFNKNNFNKVAGKLKKLCIDDIESYGSFIDKGVINKKYIDRVKMINTIVTNNQIRSIEETLQVKKPRRSNEIVKKWCSKYLIC